MLNPVKVMFGKLSNSISVLALALFVSACGGGGGESDESGLGVQHILKVNFNGEGSISSSPSGIECGSDCTKAFDEKSTVSLIATPTQGFEFIAWGGDCSGTSGCKVTLSANKSVNAIFAEIATKSFTLNVMADGEGSISSFPAGISCGSDCSHQFAKNTRVSLTATASEGHQFVGWRGACSGNSACKINMSAAREVAALFQPIVINSFALNVNVSGNGKVTSSPAGINCGSDCSQEYFENSNISLLASPAQGFEFVAWGGACTGNGACNISMTSALVVYALFQEIAAVTNTLTVVVSGQGSVISTPAGINCGNDCSQDYAENTNVALSVVTADGFEFSAWGGNCSGAASCNVSMNTDKTVIATFTEVAAQEFTLNTTANTGGKIISSPAGIDCGSDCSQTFQQDSSVTLTVIADDGYELSAWGGSCNGVNACVVVMTSNKSVSATFEEVAAQDFTLSVSSSNGGKVTSSPAGVDCGSDCEQVFAKDTSITLTAVADNGFKLDSWGGSCSGNVDCNVSMTADKSVSATFIADEVPGGELAIADMGMHEVSYGDTFEYQPQISGGATICRKDLGHDDVQVDSETGKITWNTAGLNFGRGFHIRIKCSNYTDSVFASMVVHVDKSGTSRLRVAGQDGVSQYIGIAGQAMSSGDTIVFPDGEYPVSVSGDGSYENAFKSTAPTNGSSSQFSTIISQSPGGVVINGEAHDGIGKQKNAFQLSTNSYVAIVGFVVKNVQRESFTSLTATRLLIDFVGAQGAGTGGLPCSNFSEAGSGYCSNAGMRVNGGSPLFQGSYDWGHNRYGIMTRSTDGSITRRSFVRLDEHRGDQPYGGFSNYCDIKHLSQDNTVFDSLAIAAPHYKNYAGLEAYPATGCESQSATLKTVGLLAVNNKLSLSLMDTQVGPTHVWDSIVSYDSEGTCTPQGNRCGKWLLQADKNTDVINSYFGKARGFEGSTTLGTAFDTADVNLTASVTIEDVPTEASTGTAPDYLPESQLYYRGRSDTFHGDSGYDELTSTRRWPIAGEDIIAANMRSYRNANALAVGGGTVDVNGNRGAAASNQSMSEYFWGYTDAKIPPLVVRVKAKGSVKRVAWEHLTSTTRDTVTGWKVMCMSSGESLLAVMNKDQLVYEDSSSCQQYAVKASYAAGDSGIAYIESVE